MYYTGLARVARKTGYRVVERKGWKTRGHGQMGSIRSVTVHHTAGRNTGNAPTLNYIQSNRGALPGPLAHYVLGRDGTIYVVAAGKCWHAGKVAKAAHGNRRAIGIEAENDGRGERWSTAQLDSYVKLCRALTDEFKISTNMVLGHKEIAVPRGRKVDPAGIDMDDFRTAVRRGYWRKDASDSTVKPAGKPKPKPSKPSSGEVKHYPKYNLKVVGKHNSESHAAWVKLMASIGHTDKDLGVAMQKWLRGLGYYPASKYVIDGVMGKYAVKGLQRFLKKKGLYKGRIDGKRGSMTVKAECRYLNQQRHYLK